MKNAHQVNTIREVLFKKQEILLSELAKMSMYIHKKVESLGRIKSYQLEYSNGNHLAMSKSVPSLSKNLDSFSNKIQEIINLEEREIDRLEKAREEKLIEIKNVENKVKLMDGFLQEIRFTIEIQSDHREQIMVDDLASIKQSRGDYE